LPLVVFPLAPLCLGLCWALSSLGAYLRDMAQLVGITVTVLMFVSPVFYPVALVPEQFRPLLYCNPLTLMIEEARAALYWGRLPDFSLLAAFWAGALLLAWLGFVWFQKIRKGFADVL
jgi:lipopolysaccharide transport system permease protein